MEGRGQEMDNGIPNSVNYKISQQVVNLPLAPIVSTPPDRRIRRGNIATRRGSAIFSPTQTLDQNNHQNYNYKLISSPPPQPPLHLQKEPTPAPAPDPDPDPPNTASLLIKYRECLKNHAANIGGHVVDGCGEFMPTGDEGTPEALRCDACDCHRNFHRKEIQGQSLLHYYAYGQTTPSSHQHTNCNPTPTAMFNFGGGRTAESSSEDLGHAVMQPSSSGSKKRFRTKFNKEQKERMSDFAEKLDWKMQKKDDKEIHKFCTEVGVNREVFKVFMHNTKQAMKKRQI